MKLLAMSGEKIYHHFRKARAEAEGEIVFQEAKPGIKSQHIEYLLSLGQHSPGLQPWRVQALGGWVQREVHMLWRESRRGWES